ncbi:MAG TPA: biotin/lipoyl-containing protein [Vicinamibacteria bacterium]|nr:biotin/lipoyl-containing protein [Vicinamibacteria bacterium]
MILEATLGARTVRVEVRGEAGRYLVTLDGQPMEVDFQATGRDFASLIVDGRSYEAGLAGIQDGYTVALAGGMFDVELKEAARGNGTPVRARAAGPVGLKAPMPGKVVRVLVQVGQPVEAGEGLLVMEAMKMENELKAPRAGRVREVHVGERQAVETGALLLVLE